MNKYANTHDLGYDDGLGLLGLTKLPDIKRKWTRSMAYLRSICLDVSNTMITNGSRIGWER